MDLNKVISFFHHSCIHETCIFYNTYDYSFNVTRTLELDEPDNEIMNETEHGIIHVTLRTLAGLKRFISEYLNTTIGSCLFFTGNILI